MDSPREIRHGEEFSLEELKNYLSENNINADDLSIKQFPGPTSLAKIFPSLLINVSFDIPPMFKNVAEFFFVSLNKSLWNMGVRGAP